MTFEIWLTFKLWFTFDLWLTFGLWLTFESWLTLELWLTFELWVTLELWVGRPTNRQTHRHINNMTWPGLRAGPSENVKIIVVFRKALEKRRKKTGETN